MWLCDYAAVKLVINHEVMHYLDQRPLTGPILSIRAIMTVSSVRFAGRLRLS